MGRLNRGERYQVLAAGGVALPPDTPIWGLQAVDLERSNTKPKRERGERGRRRFHPIDSGADASLSRETDARPTEEVLFGSQVSPEQVISDAMDVLMRRSGDADPIVSENFPVPVEDLL